MVLDRRGKYNCELVKFDVTGSSVEETITLTTALMNHYYTAINNITRNIKAQRIGCYFELSYRSMRRILPYKLRSLN